MKRLALLLAGPLVATTAWAQAPGPARPPAAAPTVPASSASSAAPPGVTSSTAPAAVAAPLAGDRLFAQALRAYHTALQSRRLGESDMRREDVAARVTESEGLLAAGRVDEAIARLAEGVEHPQFELYADYDEGRAALKPRQPL